MRVCVGGRMCVIGERFRGLGLGVFFSVRAGVYASFWRGHLCPCILVRVHAF
jgi:hypothetical protein